MKKLCFITFAAVATMATVVAAGTQVLIEHQGATAPVQEGWRKMVSKSGEVGPVISDRHKDAWKTFSWGFPIEYDSGKALYQTVLTGADWALSATLRILTGPNVGMMIRTGSEQIILGFDHQAD